MKKTALMLIATGLLSVATAAVAGPEDGYFSTLHPLVSATGGKAPRFPATDITVVNASNNVIFAIVPNTPINDLLNPNSQPDHIRNNNGAFNTTLILQDPYRATFDQRVVCPRALVTVFGGPGAYRINVDEEYCH